MLKVLGSEVVSSERFCNNCYYPLNSDVILTNNVIATYNVTSQGECLLHCIQNKGCLSYNFQYNYNTEKKRCELNSKTISSCPLGKILKEGHGYFEEINVLEEKVSFKC